MQISGVLFQPGKFVRNFELSEQMFKKDFRLLLFVVLFFLYVEDNPVPRLFSWTLKGAEEGKRVCKYKMELRNSTIRWKNLKTVRISTVKPTFHTNLSRKRGFSKTLFKPEEFENAYFAFLCGRKTIWKQSFSKSMT